ncbi:hypothetical protein Q5H93_15430 [Hymenobacter sp. ASUV-10]|uniref:Lipoprotein n=1 Tax=Hymenobacter aranciens TaxID=3063996 RepID=A0ABT9BCZ1_9BACT|nr:hypothetical protein [Hymenobacter sp. ASUV-10]MDO7876135.1 hypothetical protein [Hymenobacter sp. ASUV-10]
MYQRLLLSATLLLAACATPPAREAKSVSTGPAAATSTAPVPTSVERRRVFSDPAAPDVFELEISGDSLLTAPAVLTIHTATGAEIYRQALPPGTLEAALVYELQPGETATTARREAYVRQRLSTFFADKNFTTPAVKPGTPYRPGLVTAAEWRALQQPGTVGFSFIVGKEDGYRLAWLPGRRQVARYAGFGG